MPSQPDCSAPSVSPGDHVGAAEEDRPEAGSGRGGRLSGDGAEWGGTRPACLAARKPHSRSLRSKLVLALAVMLTVVVAVDETVRQLVIVPEFANLERAAAMKDTRRVLSALHAEVDFLAEAAMHDVSKLRDPADVAALKRFYADHFSARDPLGANSDPLAGRPPAERRIQWAAISRPPHWEWIAGGEASGSPAPEPLTRSILTAAASEEASPRGIGRATDGRLYLFAALPLGRLGAAGKASGQQLGWPAGAHYVVGRQLDRALIATLEERTSVPFTIRPLDGSGKVNRLTAGRAGRLTPAIVPQPAARSVLEVNTPLLGPTGTPLAQLRVHLPRDVTLRSNRTTAFARYLSLCGVSASLVLLLLLLQRIVVGRLQTIREQTEKIAESGLIDDAETEPVLRVAGDDEIGQLAQSFDRMRLRLGDAQRRLSDASHAAGMSLVADTVIHNVGNVLTNVNSLIETAASRVDALRTESLDRLAGRLRDDQVDPELCQAMPDYLHRLSEKLSDDKCELAELLKTLSDNVQHIHQVICDQRRHTQPPVEWTRVDLETVIFEAINCCQASLDRERVRVEVQAGAAARVWTDRSLLLQILINIITNAGNAMRGLGDRRPRLLIAWDVQPTAVRIQFRDNGCGMEAATLDRVFEAHFTTRRSGSGLGLHFCAIAMRRIGGKIRAESGGAHRGATFTIELPRQPNGEIRVAPAADSERRSTPPPEPAGVSAE